MFNTYAYATTDNTVRMSHRSNDTFQSTWELNKVWHRRSLIPGTPVGWEHVGTDRQEFASKDAAYAHMLAAMVNEIEGGKSASIHKHDDQIDVFTHTNENEYRTVMFVTVV